MENKYILIIILQLFLLSYIIYIFSNKNIDLNTQNIKSFTIVNFIGAVVLIILLNTSQNPLGNPKGFLNTQNHIIHILCILYLLFNILNIKYVYDNNIKLVKAFNIINLILLISLSGYYFGIVMPEKSNYNDIRKQEIDRDYMFNQLLEDLPLPGDLP